MKARPDLESRVEIMDLITAYSVHVDDGAFDLLEPDFADEMVFDIKPDPGIVPVPVRGRREVRKILEERRNIVTQTAQRRHVTSNTIFDSFTPDEARTRTFLTVISASKLGEGAKVHGCGVYHDRFVRRGGRWLFAERVLYVDAIGK
jgi:hypothetical protein